ncbi:1-deoxy-D-xylulose-5-phosphate reductoisomerase, partial [bacterium]|nr:1-deoxy-D-xylulose-5-phosphate reductoisomerase [bacterium]
MKKIALLGSTGSIGVNCLEVVDQLAEEFVVTVLSTHRRIDQLYDQAKRFRPQIAAITGAAVSDDHRAAFNKLGVELIAGAEALLQLAGSAEYDLLVNAVVGSIGFRPTLTALQRGKPVALANKETMVIGGELVSAAAEHHRAAILPIDSEHSAVFQCLLGESEKNIEAILLTGSGGPFRTLAKEAFASITPAQALKHPNWSMGPKITIDSATMMNKGLEVIEAHWLFRVAVEKIRVVVHPQSIIHSMVLFCDGSIKAQMGLPDMRLPIQLALTWPERKPSAFPRLEFGNHLSLTFTEP